MKDVSLTSGHHGIILLFIACSIINVFGFSLCDLVEVVDA